MESVWWVFGQLHEKGLVYRGFKVMPYSCACNTPLSNFEVQQNYKEVDDPAVVCAFPLLDEPNTKFVAWTTTPWTLPSNLALCVNPALEYIRIKETESGTEYILLAARLVQLYPDLGNPKKKKEAEKKFTEVARFPGSELAGKQYSPPFAYFEAHRKTGCFQVITGDFVTSDAGTGIVHCAPAFGEEDYKACLANGVIRKGDPLVCPLDANGRFTDEVPEFKGRFVKDADKDIIKLLKSNGRLVNAGQIKHQYPFCWRSDTPLIYRAVPGTFVNVESLRDRLLANNAQTYWVPAFVKEKRFHNWLENARDWAISRNRFWGTPIPMWMSEDGEEVVIISSVKELEERSGVSPITDLHRESIDHLTIPSKKGKGTLKRVDEVFDCWFESGSMPYAQAHYPFEDKNGFEASFPADFIAEGIDQTRGWFYTLMVLSTALFDKPAFKNLICNGLVLAEDGRKMSKRLKNYPDPQHILSSYGADALRLYLINSPVVRAEDLRFSEAGVKQVLNDVFLRWYNGYRLFIQSANTLELTSGTPFKRDLQCALSSRNTMDRWILAMTHSLLRFTRTEMDAYRLYTVVPRLVNTIEQLSNTYIRMNKARFGGEGGAEDRAHSLCTLYEVLLLMCKLMAPLTPFFTELTWQNLVKAMPEGDPERLESVHFGMIPEVNESAIDEQIETDMAIFHEVIMAGRTMRERHNLKMRTPLPDAIVLHMHRPALESIQRVEPYVLEELNVRSVVTHLVSDKPELVRFKCVPNHSALGKRFGKEYKTVQVQIAKLGHDELAGFMKKGSIEVGGHAFSAEDIKVSLEYAGDLGERDAMVLEDGGGVVLLSKKPTADMLEEATAREVCAKVQKLRKDAGLQKSDEVEVGFECASENLSRLLLTSSKYVAGRIGKPLLPISKLPGLAVPLLPKREAKVGVQTIGEGGAIEASEETISFSLCRACVFFNDTKLTALCSDPKVADGVVSYVHGKDYSRLKGELAASSGTLSIRMDGQQVTIKQGEHFYLNSVDAIQGGAVSLC
uniref:isoleucine--tRNA ligase n=1 Tax=Haptolina brevifila TaxID=156173 RepID=A0A7S2FMG0_9EUKA